MLLWEAGEGTIATLSILGPKTKGVWKFVAGGKVIVKGEGAIVLVVLLAVFPMVAFPPKSAVYSLSAAAGSSCASTAAASWTSSAALAGAGVLAG